MTQPEKKFKAGAVSATIWKNGEGDQSYNTISLERAYKDKTGNWKNTNSLRLNDLPKARMVLDKAYEYVVLNGQESAKI